MNNIIIISPPPIPPLSSKNQLYLFIHPSYKQVNLIFNFQTKKPTTLLTSPFCDSIWYGQKFHRIETFIPIYLNSQRRNPKNYTSLFDEICDRLEPLEYATSKSAMVARENMYKRPYTDEAWKLEQTFSKANAHG